MEEIIRELMKRAMANENKTKEDDYEERARKLSLALIDALDEGCEEGTHIHSIWVHAPIVDEDDNLVGMANMNCEGKQEYKKETQDQPDQEPTLAELRRLWRNNSYTPTTQELAQLPKEDLDIIKAVYKAGYGLTETPGSLVIER
jgi:hypothetical protein